MIKSLSNISLGSGPENNLPLTSLGIKQLKKGYQHLIQGYENTYETEFHYHRYLSYFLITNKIDNTVRLLFYPVTIHEKSEPSACDLLSLLVFIRDHEPIKNKKIDQIIIPIGEKSAFDLFMKHYHMVTLVIDILAPINTKAVSDIDTRKYKINAKIIDSKSLSLPFWNQTEAIHNMLKMFYLIIKFDREFLSHQNLLDNESCCYFTMKTINCLLANPLNSYRGLKINTLIPKPNTWISTSQNWLTELDRTKIKQTILEAFEQDQPPTKTIKAINESIIELD